MAGSIYSWSTTAASNASSDGDINWNEGQAPSTVNNSARQMMGRVAEWVKDQGALTAGGTANAITVTANSAFTSYATGQVLAFKAAADNTGATTLSVNSIGARSIRKFTPAGETALEAGDIKDDGIFIVHYDAAANSAAGGWILINPVIASLALLGLAITSTDAGAGIGPDLDLVRNSVSPAVNDSIGSLNFKGKDSAGNTDVYARIFGQITDPTSTSEDADLCFQTMKTGVPTTALRLGNTAVRFFFPAAPAANDGASLGMASLQWSGVYVASGRGINWGNGDVTITHSSDALAFAGAVDGYSFDAPIRASILGGATSSPGAGDTATGAAINSGTGYFSVASGEAVSANANSSGQNITIRRSGTTVGSISQNGTATNFNTSSDGRRKKNLRDFDSGGLLDALEACRFDWISGGTGYGVIAQDAQKVFPDAITEGEDGFLQADYSKFVPLLIREVKVLRARVARLELSNYAALGA